MRTRLLLSCLLLCTSLSFAQLSTTINDIPVELRQATNGPLELHYCLFQRQYYFFIVDSSKTIIALSDSESDPLFFKHKLSELTNGYGNLDTIRYQLKSLRTYINSYNASVIPDYKTFEEPKRLSWYGMLFTGLTNNPFVSNMDNISNPMIGIEIEMSGNIPTPKHSGFFQYRFAFASESFDYQTQEFALGYRYRFLRRNWGALFGQVKAATFNISKASISAEDNELLTIDSNSFDAAFIFGIGADIRLGNNSYLTLLYSELFAIFLDNEGNFPLDFAIGYKLRF